jgi:hypothetical protein
VRFGLIPTAPPASLTDAEVKMLIVGSAIVIRCPGEGDQFSPIVSTFMCEIVFCQSLEERQVRRDFSYGF